VTSPARHERNMRPQQWLQGLEDLAEVRPQSGTLCTKLREMALQRPGSIAKIRSPGAIPNLSTAWTHVCRGGGCGMQPRA
jgi:hypothetical protein